MVGSSSELSRETCQLQNVDGESSTKAVWNAANNVPGPAMRADIATGAKSRHTIPRMMRLTGVRALIVAMTPENRTWSSQGGQEGRFERAKP
jgi:hypothetical protein